MSQLFGNSIIVDQCSEDDKGHAVPEKSDKIDDEVTLSLLRMDEVEKRVKEPANRPRNRRIYTKQNILRWILISFICIAVGGGFTVPIILYVADTHRGNNTRILSNFNFDSCSINATSAVQVSKNTCGYRVVTVVSKISSH